MDRLRADAPPRPEITGDTSDGYHTFDELYSYRKAYHALVCNEWARQGRYDVHKSWRHSDGEPCFGGGWFIVVAETPQGQISNHYKTPDWDLFQCREAERGNPYDGHTPAIALDRLLALARVADAPPREVEQEQAALRAQRLNDFRVKYFSTTPIKIDDLAAEAMLVVIDQECRAKEAEAARAVDQQEIARLREAQGEAIDARYIANDWRQECLAAEALLVQRDAEIAAKDEYLRWLVGLENQTFAECSLAEEVIGRARAVLEEKHG